MAGAQRLGIRLAIMLSLLALVSLLPPHLVIQRLESPYYRIYSTVAVPMVGGTSLVLQVLAVAACLVGALSIARGLAVAVVLAEVALLFVMSGYGNGFWVYAIALLGALRGSLDLGFWCLIVPPIAALIVALSILRLPRVAPAERL